MSELKSSESKGITLRCLTRGTPQCSKCCLCEGVASAFLVLHPDPELRFELGVHSVFVTSRHCTDCFAVAKKRFALFGKVYSIEGTVNLSTFYDFLLEDE